MPKVYTRLNLALASVETIEVSEHDISALELADSLAKESECRPHRLGAVLYNRGRIVGKGLNRLRSHPLQAKYNPFSIRLHAEISAIINGLRTNPGDVEGASIAVSRVSRKGTFGCSYPCEHCLPALLEANVRRIVCYDLNDKVTAIKI